MARILIADDDAVVRAGYQPFLDADPSTSLVGEAASGSETIAQLRQSEWDLLLLDIHMPDRNGLDVLALVTSGYPKVRILIMSGLPEDHYARNVLRPGASGYLSKSGDAEGFLRAVRTVLAGRRYVRAELAQHIAANLERDHDISQPLHSRLLARELQTFCKLAAGRGVTEIAEELGLSVKTVSTYRSRIKEKVNLASNAGFTEYASSNGLIQ
jgi:two-component system invasion response regulator UvrY